MENKKIYGMMLGLMIFIASLTAIVINNEAPGQVDESALVTTVLKVGKADAIVLKNKDKAMIIDTGEEDDGQKVCDFLKNQKISKVEALIITHFDKDHVGGADMVVRDFDIGKVYMPDYEGERSEYADFINTMDEKSITPDRLDSQVSFDFADCSVVIDPPESYDMPDPTKEYDNNFSLITTVKHGSNTLIFTGDAQKKRLREWLNEGRASKCSFLKVPHHGVYNDELENLLSQTTPEYAAICDSKKHEADQATLEVLKEHEVETYETKNGDITVVSDGEKIKLYQ